MARLRAGHPERYPVARVGTINCGKRLSFDRCAAPDGPVKPCHDEEEKPCHDEEEKPCHDEEEKPCHDEEEKPCRESIVRTFGVSGSLNRAAAATAPIV